ncbi:MAG: sugar ABC transporter permease, partial [Actinobacteria bacterium]|nr:sugar ABC transporter permease [Actinomycetota bacterium]
QDWGAGSALGMFILIILFIFSVFYLLAVKIEDGDK